MAKRICKKKGKKWYYRFYVEDASGNLVIKEYAGTESKSETERTLLRQAMDDYESLRNSFTKSENITIGELLDIWAEGFRGRPVRSVMGQSRITSVLTNGHSVSSI